MLTYKIAARFDKGYIADPYWPERERVINIDKQSGMSRARSSANRPNAAIDTKLHSMNPLKTQP